MNEFQIISKYFSKLTKSNKGAFKLTDDIFYDFNKKLAISVDTYNENVHFINFDHPDFIIKKCLRSSLSDLICKGIQPKYYFISASGNKSHFKNKNLLKISKALVSEQKKYSIKMSGGDTTYSKKLSFTFVVIGYSNKLPILRNGAKLGDDIYVTNSIGDPFVGLNLIKKKIKNFNNNYFIKSFYLPKIPFKFSRYLNQFANSSIDVSDGLIGDLNRLIRTSKKNYKLFENRIPISNNLMKYIKSKKIDKKKMINNGDDYQILFTANKNKRNLIKRISNKTNTPVTKIGKVINQNPKKKLKIQGICINFNNLNIAFLNFFCINPAFLN